MEREGKPYGFPSHILSLSRARKAGKSALRCPLRRALAPRRGHSPYSLPPKNPKLRRCFGRLVRDFSLVLRTRRRLFLLGGWCLESVPPSLDLLWTAAAALPASLDLPPGFVGGARWSVCGGRPPGLAVVGAFQGMGDGAPGCRALRVGLTGRPGVGRAGAQCAPLRVVYRSISVGGGRCIGGWWGWWGGGGDIGACGGVLSGIFGGRTRRAGSSRPTGGSSDMVRENRCRGALLAGRVRPSFPGTVGVDRAGAQCAPLQPLPEGTAAFAALGQRNNSQGSGASRARGAVRLDARWGNEGARGLWFLAGLLSALLPAFLAREKQVAPGGRNPR